MYKIMSIVLSFLLVSEPIFAETMQGRPSAQRRGFASRIEQNISKQVPLKSSAQDKCTYLDMLARLEQDTITWSCVENAVLYLEKLDDPAKKFSQQKLTLTQSDKLRKKIISWNKEPVIVDIIGYYLGILGWDSNTINPYTGRHLDEDTCRKDSWQVLIKNEKIRPGCFYGALVYYETHPNEFDTTVRDLALQGKQRAQAYVATLSNEKKEKYKWALYFQEILYNRLDKLIQNSFSQGAAGNDTSWGNSREMVELRQLLADWPRQDVTQEIHENKINPEVKARLEKLVRAYENGVDLTTFIEILAKGNDSLDSPSYVSPVLLTYSFMLWAKSNAVRPQDKKKVLNYVSGDYPFRVKWAAAQAATELAGGKFNFTEAEKQLLLSVFAQINKNLPEENKNNQVMYRMLLHLTGKLYSSPEDALASATSAINSAHIPPAVVVVCAPGARQAGMYYALPVIAGIGVYLWIVKSLENATHDYLSSEYSGALAESLSAVGSAYAVEPVLDSLSADGENWIIREYVTAGQSIFDVSIVLETPALREHLITLNASAGSVAISGVREASLTRVLNEGCPDPGGGRYFGNTDNYIVRFEDLFNNGDLVTKQAFAKLCKNNQIKKWLKEYSRNGKLQPEFWKKLAASDFEEWQQLSKIAKTRPFSESFVRAIYVEGKGWRPEVVKAVKVTGTRLVDIVDRQWLKSFVTCTSDHVAKFVENPHMDLGNGKFYRYGAHEKSNGHFHYESWEKDRNGEEYLCNQEVYFGKGKDVNGQKYIDLFLAGISCL